MTEVDFQHNIQPTVPTTLQDGQFGLIHDGKTYWYQVTDNGKKVEFYSNSYLFDKMLSSSPATGLWNFDVTHSSGAKEAPADNWIPPSNTFPVGTIVKIEEFDVTTNADGTLAHTNYTREGHPIFAQTSEYVETLTTDPFTGATSDRKRESDYYSMSDVLSTRARVGAFNPPPHKASRTISPTAFANYKLTDSANLQTIENLQKVNKRGFFYQDIDTAFDNDGKHKRRGKLWGFQFMYNPTTISYTNSVNNQIDWTNNLDVATALAGSQQISFSIFLNRLIDMSSLRNFETIPGNQCTVYYNPLDHLAKGTDGSYERVITAEDANGILKRGTEYDLEYLYRVINGDPAIGPTMKMQTSDFGFMSGVPVWLKFNDNVRYKVTIQSIAVEHVMFTENMVPVVTQVQLSMIRIPTPKTGATADVQAWYDQQFKIKSPNFAGSPFTTGDDSDKPNDWG